MPDTFVSKLTEIQKWATMAFWRGCWKIGALHISGEKVNKYRVPRLHLGICPP